MAIKEDYISIHTGIVMDAAISAVIAGRAGLQGVYLNGTELTPDSSNKVSISLTGDYYNKTQIGNLLDAKVDKVEGKGLSTEDFTTAEQTKLANIESEANKTIVVQTTGNSTTSVMSQDAVTLQLNTKATVSYYTATLSSSSWSASTPYTQTLNVTGILSTDKPVVDLSAPTASNLESWGLVASVQSGSGTLTFTCYDGVPTENLDLNIMVVR